MSVQKNLTENILAAKFANLFPTKVGHSRLTYSRIPGASKIGKCHTDYTTFETTTLKRPQSRVYRLQSITSDFSRQPKTWVWAYQVKGIWKEFLHFQNMNTGIVYHHLPKTEQFHSQVGIIFFFLQDFRLSCNSAAFGLKVHAYYWAMQLYYLQNILKQLITGH